MSTSAIGCFIAKPLGTVSQKHNDNQCAITRLTKINHSSCKLATFGEGLSSPESFGDTSEIGRRFALGYLAVAEPGVGFFPREL